jgi:hypothetical protein
MPTPKDEQSLSRDLEEHPGYEGREKERLFVRVLA